MCVRVKEGEERREEDSRATSRPESKTTSASPLAILKSFQGRGPGHLEIRDDVDIGSRRDRVARGGSPFTKSNIRVIYHLTVANAREGVREAICAP